jgi:hypothetical protein
VITLTNGEVGWNATFPICVAGDASAPRKRHLPAEARTPNTAPIQRCRW